MDLTSGIRPFEPEKKVADTETIRKFVKDISAADEIISDCKEDLKEVLESNQDISDLKEQIKDLKKSIKDIIETNAVISSYISKLNDAVEDRKQLISDAKQDGIDKKTVDISIKMAKNDIDPQDASDIYKNI